MDTNPPSYQSEHNQQTELLRRRYDQFATPILHLYVLLQMLPFFFGLYLIISLLTMDHYKLEMDCAGMFVYCLLYAIAALILFAIKDNVNNKRMSHLIYGLFIIWGLIINVEDTILQRIVTPESVLNTTDVYSNETSIIHVPSETCDQYYQAHNKLLWVNFKLVFWGTLLAQVVSLIWTVYSIPIRHVLNSADSI